MLALKTDHFTCRCRHSHRRLCQKRTNGRTDGRTDEPAPVEPIQRTDSPGDLPWRTSPQASRGSFRPCKKPSSRICCYRLAHRTNYTLDYPYSFSRWRDAEAREAGGEEREFGDFINRNSHSWVNPALVGCIIALMLRSRNYLTWILTCIYTHQ